MKRNSFFVVIVALCISLVQPIAHATERKFQAEGCHAKVSAILQIKNTSSWIDVIAAQGWDIVASCPSTNPYEPWAMADVPIGATIRWHIYVPGVWDFYTTESQVQEIFDPSSVAQGTAQPDIEPSNYPYVAALARASILADQPVTTSAVKIDYKFENGVPIENQNLIKEGAANFISHFGNILNYSETSITIVAYKTLHGGLALANAVDPSDSEFHKNMSDMFLKQPDPEKIPTVGMGGWSTSSKRLVVMGAPYFNASIPNVPTYVADPVVPTHELAHEVQASINKGINLRNPVWLCEGGAQVIGAVMSVFQGKDYWVNGGRDQWANRIPANRTIADLKIMENEDPKMSEYTTGAALSEYLIAWGGFSNSLLVNQIAFKIQNPDKMAGFRQAFKIVYGQSLDDFYIQALPYINYVSAKWESEYAVSPEALAFVASRIASIKTAGNIDAAAKIAADKAAADKILSDKLIADKAAADKILSDKLIADKAAADKILSDKLIADKAATKKKTTVICLKGKLSKRVTAINPVCPKGYKKK